MARDFKPGVRFKLSGRFLRSTGQIAGGEGQRTWTVRACECRSCAEGRFVCSDQAQTPEPGWYTAEELAEHPELGWRHFAKDNLVIKGEADIRNSP